MVNKMKGKRFYFKFNKVWLLYPLGFLIGELCARAADTPTQIIVLLLGGIVSWPLMEDN